LLVPRSFQKVGRLLAVAGSAAAVSGCASDVPTGGGNALLLASRITVQDLGVEPAQAVAGTSATIRFRLLRNVGGDAPIYWRATLVERPAGNGALSAVSGGPVRSGATIEIAYAASTPTTAFVTIVPASREAGPTGDGSGDWRSFTIDVLASRR
jgi:hypothetical protein